MFYSPFCGRGGDTCEVQIMANIIANTKQIPPSHTWPENERTRETRTRWCWWFPLLRRTPRVLTVDGERKVEQKVCGQKEVPEKGRVRDRESVIPVTLG